MPPFILIGTAAGIASAILLVSATMGGFGGRLLLYFLAPLPAFLAGLGWGSAAAGVAAVATTLGCALLLGAKSAGVVLLTQAIPIAILCYLAQLNRPVAVAGESDMRPQSQAATEWYPVGRLVAAAVLMSGAIAFFTVFLLGASMDDLRKIMRSVVDDFLKSVPTMTDRKLGEEEIGVLVDTAVQAMPAVGAVFCLGGLLLNLYLAARITLTSGRLPRPWPDLAGMSFPRGFGLGLAASLVLMAVLPGYSTLAASAYAGAFLFAFMLLGLAVIHGASRPLTLRPLVLAALYLSLLVLNGWAAMALAVLGAMEPLIPSRRRPLPPLPPRDRDGA
jgi:hypothetical protein